MPHLFASQDDSPTKPGLQIVTSSSQSSSSQTSKDFPLGHPSRRYRHPTTPNVEVDHVLCTRSEVGSSDSLIGHEQGQFISSVLPYVRSKRLNEEEIQQIRYQAEQTQLPYECVDQLIALNERYHPERLSLRKHGSQYFEHIEHVDESDNILAYFSRMATLKQGGHFPSLNTDAISDFVDPCDIMEGVEVDLDVGYVNKSLNLSLEENDILQVDSWDDCLDDRLSQVSTTIAGTRNRYGARDVGKSDAFESLLVGGSGIDRAKHNQEDELDSSKNDSIPSMQMEETSTTIAESDWAPISRPNKTYRYGYERDLAEWRKKRDIALWKAFSNTNTLMRSFFSCHAMAESAVADELNGLLWGIRGPPRLRGMQAVKILRDQTTEREKNRQERNRLRHIPERLSATPRPWQLPYRERTKAFSGYIGVDVYSLLDTAAALHTLDSRDAAPWETRDVRQHFLHDRSITLSRNWFGRLRKENGNDLIRYRPCRPNTMGMPIDASESSVDGDFTDSRSKTTASNYSKSSRRNSQVNKTATLSFTSGEASDSHFEDDDSTRCTRSELGQSATSRDGTSTFHTDGKHRDLTEDFSSMMSSMLTGHDTYTTYSNLRNRDYGVAWLSDDAESLGVSAILDAEDEMENREIAGLVKRGRKASSFSDASVDSSNHWSGSRSTSYDSDSRSSGSYFSEDSDSTWSRTEGSSEDARECGTFVNVKPKLGERASRVTPDHTSHLLRSRFRKKYLLSRGHSRFDK